MLSYRTLFTINPETTSDIVQEVLDETFNWLRSKNYDVEAATANSDVSIGSDARMKWIVPEVGDLSNSHRLILTEQSPAGEWVSTLTVRRPLEGRPWVWMDVEGPDWAGAPRLIRSLIKRFPCSDRGVKLTQTPVIVYAQQVDELIRLLSRPGRRTLSFIAGSSAALPLKPWRDFVGELLKQTVGQSSGYVLDPVDRKSVV